MSIKICEKVKSHGTTTCNEVADELLCLISQELEEDGKLKDDKNIRRRLYDAVNVLDAVDVLVKTNKDITWKGLSTNHAEQGRRLVSEHDGRRKQIKEKEEAMREQLIQHVTFHNLVCYNQGRHHLPFVRNADNIFAPFVLISAHPYAEIHCEASRDMSDVMLDVNAPFFVNDENSVLNQMGL